MWDKIRNSLYKLSDLLELLMGAVVVVAIVIAAAGLVPQLDILWEDRGDGAALIHFLEYVFNLVIGIEFLKMLCKPKADTIIEVLIFLVARHMIIGETAAFEDLLSILSMSILFLLKAYVTTPAKKDGISSFFGNKKKDREETSQ